MLHHRLTSLTLAASIISLAACTANVGKSGSGMSLETTAGSQSSYAGQLTQPTAINGLADALRAQGLEVNFAPQQTSSARPVFPAAKAYDLSLNGQNVQVYEFADEQSAMAGASTISADGGMVLGQSVAWVGQPHFYRIGNMILLYLGNNPSLIHPLEQLAGAPFAGKNVSSSALTQSGAKL